MFPGRAGCIIFEKSDSGVNLGLNPRFVLDSCVTLEGYFSVLFHFFIYEQLQYRLDVVIHV